MKYKKIFNKIRKKTEKKTHKVIKERKAPFFYYNGLSVGLSVCWFG